MHVELYQPPLEFCRGWRNVPGGPDGAFGHIVQFGILRSLLFFYALNASIGVDIKFEDYVDSKSFGWSGPAFADPSFDRSGVPVTFDSPGSGSDGYADAPPGAAAAAAA